MQVGKYLFILSVEGRIENDRFILNSNVQWEYKLLNA